MKRTLTLKKETLTSLTGEELRDVAGARATMPCVTGPDTCAVSRALLSLCGCLSDYCSIDVC